MTKIDISEYKELLKDLQNLKLNLGLSITGLTGIIDEFSEDTKLKGVAWSTTKAYFSVGYPLPVNGLADVFYTMITTLENFISSFESEVTASEVKLDLDQLEDLQSRRDTLQREKNSLLHQLAELAADIPGLGSLLEDQSLTKTQEKVKILEDFRSFISRHEDDFLELDVQMTNVLKGLEELGKQRSFNGANAGYSPINLANLGWASELDDFHKDHGAETARQQATDIANFKDAAEVAGTAVAMESFGMNQELGNVGNSLYNTGKKYYSEEGLQEVPVNGSKNVKESFEKASGANNLKINSNAKNHLANSEGFVRKGGQGVKGGHNIDSFYGELNAQGFNIDDCIINKKPHPTIKGIYEIEYKIPAMDNKGNIIPNQYKNIGQPKTVYDPNYFSDSTIYNLGVEAMQNGKISGREISGIASNGLEFRGFINEAGEVTNFFPVYPK